MYNEHANKKGGDIDMAVPQRRVGKTRKRKRRANFKLTVEGLATCSNCGALIPSHTVCPECGYYKGNPARNEEKVEAQQVNPNKRKRASQDKGQEPVESEVSKSGVKRTKKVVESEPSEE